MGLLEELTKLVERFKGRAWDGSASNYDSTEEYCAACLIDVNQGDEKAQSHCMLPVKSPGSDSYNFEAIRAAAGGHGITQVKKPSDVPQDEWESAVKKAAGVIVSQYEANDQEPPEAVMSLKRAMSLGRLGERVFYELMEREYDAWPMDIYLDGSDIFAILNRGGKLYRCSVEIEDEEIRVADPESWVQVTEVYQPTGQSRVFRAKDGRMRWLNVSCSAVLNKVGEIDSTDLFDSFVAHAEETGEYPVRVFYHQTKLEIGQADLLARDGFLYITSGYFYDTPLAQAVARAHQSGWVDSIGYKPTAVPDLLEVSPDLKIPVYRQGINKEISSLPSGEQAALFVLSRVSKEVIMRDTVRKALDELREKHGLPQEEIDALIEDIDATNRSIESDPDIIARDAGEVEPPVQETEVELGEELVSAIVERLAQHPEIVREMPDLAALTEQMAQIAERLNALEELEISRTADVLGVSPSRIRVNLRARERQTEEEEDDDVVSSADRAAQVLAQKRGG